MRLPMSGTSADAAAALTTRETPWRLATAVVFATRVQPSFWLVERVKDMARRGRARRCAAHARARIDAIARDEPRSGGSGVMCVPYFRDITRV